jgi:hypothetical protein
MQAGIPVTIGTPTVAAMLMIRVPEGRNRLRAIPSGDNR